MLLSSISAQPGDKKNISYYAAALFQGIDHERKTLVGLFFNQRAVKNWRIQINYLRLVYSVEPFPLQVSNLETNSGID